MGRLSLVLAGKGSQQKRAIRAGFVLAGLFFFLGLDRVITGVFLLVTHDLTASFLQVFHGCIEEEDSKD